MSGDPVEKFSRALYHRTCVATPRRQKRAAGGCLVLGPGTFSVPRLRGPREVIGAFLAYFSLCCFPKPCKGGRGKQY